MVLPAMSGSVRAGAADGGRSRSTIWAIRRYWPWTRRPRPGRLDLPGQKFLLGEGRDRHAPNAEKRPESSSSIGRISCTWPARPSPVDRIMICCGAGGNTGGGSVLELIETAQRYARYTGSKSPSRSVGVLMALPDAGELRWARVAATRRVTPAVPWPRPGRSLL
jgi:hypothetical protein